MEPGLYLTFFTAGESFENELPPVGPVEHLVMRERSLLAERKSVDQGKAFGGASRLIEAELELQRAMGIEPGGARRPDVRVNAPNGVYLRFASFGDAPEPEPLPELGPYAVVIVSRDFIEADGNLLATRAGANHRLWELTSQSGSALTGLIRPDVAFRTESTTYHPRIQSPRPKREVFAATQLPLPTPQREPEPEPLAPRQVAEAPPVAQAVDNSLPSAPWGQAKIGVLPSRPSLDRVEATPLARLGMRTQASQEATAVAPRSSHRESVGIASRLRFLTIGALVLAVVLFGAYSLRTTSTSANVVGIGKTVNGPRWAYAVIKVVRASEAGAARPQGTYLVVWIELTNRGSESARLGPTDFGLVDRNGARFAPLYQTDPAYRSDSNRGSPYTWISSFPVGKPISVPVIFDVNPRLQGIELVILEVPAVHVRLD